MRPHLAVLLPLLFLAQPVLAQSAPPVPAQDDTGARPGNDIGTGMSLPLSNNASNIGADDTQSDIAPRLPVPEAGDDAAPAAYLRSARAALLGGRTGEAQEALERAESRLLDRDVDPRRANIAIQDPMVQDVSRAREALAAGDRAMTLQFIEAALTRRP